MENTREQAAKDSKLAIDAQFHLPNICTVQSLLFAIIVGSLISLMFAVVSDGISHFNWQHFSLVSLFILWIVLINMTLLCQLRIFLARLSLVKGALLCFGSVLLTTFLISLSAQWWQVHFFKLAGQISLIQTVEHVLVAAILAGVSLRYLYLQESLHIQQQAELASRIQALQSRIRPHFLFNSMNIIASLIESDPKLAEHVVEDLSELFRATLSDANQLVPLNREIELGKSYVHIESLRLGDRLIVDWQMDSFDDDVLVPHLSLQPLLENAIYHGIQPLAEGGTISVVVHRDHSSVNIRVRNPIPLPDEESPTVRRGNSLALENMQKRLQAYYGDRARFFAGQRISETGERLFEVNFSCPLAT